MKRLDLSLVTTLALLSGCDGISTTVEPAPVEVIIINNDTSEDKNILFEGVRVAYDTSTLNEIDITLTMLDNTDISLFNFVLEVKLDDGTIDFTEPNASREDGRITVTDVVRITENGTVTLSMLYYGDQDYKLSKQSFLVEGI